MNSIGFPISKKKNEYRRALVLADIEKIEHKSHLFFEEGYGEVLGYSDIDLIDLGCNVVSHDEVLTKDIIVDPKIGDADYLSKLNNQIVFGWIHAVQNKDITDIIVKNKLTAYAWEDMYANGRHVFWKNNEIAGESAVLHGFQCHGLMPNKIKVALLGRGNVAMGALKVLTLLGADVSVFSRSQEQLFKDELVDFDVVVNAILWDTNRKDHIIYREDLCRMKKNALIIDISCDRHGGIETSEPTTIDNPTYVIDGVRHYVVDNTPSLYYKTATSGISKQVVNYIDMLILGDEDEVLKQCKCINQGRIVDERIINFQQRKEAV